jgi:hypothetical protein
MNFSDMTPYGKATVVVFFVWIGFVVGILLQELFR